MTLAPLTGIGLAVYDIDTHQSHESLDSFSVDRVVDSTIDLIPQTTATHPRILYVKLIQQSAQGQLLFVWFTPFEFIVQGGSADFK